MNRQIVFFSKYALGGIYVCFNTLFQTENFIQIDTDSKNRRDAYKNVPFSDDEFMQGKD